MLERKLTIGRSKYNDQREGRNSGDGNYKSITSENIYSRSTFKTYLKHGCYFAKWAKEVHGCKDLKSAHEHVNEYLQYRIDMGLSPYTQKLDASALAKIYGCRTTDFIKTQTRYRAGITRSRGKKAMDKHFSETKNRDFIEFCRATGLRRSELERLRSDQLRYDEKDNTYSLEIKGKGGRIRFALILTQEAVDRIKSVDGRVWERIPSKADIHSYRADYCRAVYDMYARPKNKIPKEDRYCCRKDRAGEWFDKPAMEIASQALGHNRINIIASHYLYSG